MLAGYLEVRVKLTTHGLYYPNAYDYELLGMGSPPPKKSSARHFPTRQKKSRVLAKLSLPHHEPTRKNYGSNGNSNVYQGFRPEGEFVG